MENNRRGFLRKVGAMSAGAALVSANPLLAIANEASGGPALAAKDGEFAISILQTTDVHCKEHTNDELF